MMYSPRCWHHCKMHKNKGCSCITENWAHKMTKLYDYNVSCQASAMMQMRSA
jgi:hypothetical protein